jgi:hypothetical protein
MTDLTHGSVRRQLVNMATPMMIGMLVQGLLSFSLRQGQLKKMQRFAVAQQ